MAKSSAPSNTTTHIREEQRSRHIVCGDTSLAELQQETNFYHNNVHVATLPVHWYSVYLAVYSMYELYT